MRNIILLIIISTLGYATGFSQYDEPLFPSRKIHLKLSDSNEKIFKYDMFKGQIFELHSETWECEAIVLAHYTRESVTHTKREISESEFNSETSGDKIVITLSSLISNYTGIDKCNDTQDYLRSGYTFLWLKEGDKYIEYQVYPSVGHAYLED